MNRIMILNSRPNFDCSLSLIVSIVVIQEKCSHVRAHDLFLESLTTKFASIRCDSYRNIEEKKCLCDNTVGLMGGDLTRKSPKPQGIFYLETKGTPPYVIPDYQTFKDTLILCKRIPPQKTRL